MTGTPLEKYSWAILLVDAVGDAVKIALTSRRDLAARATNLTLGNTPAGGLNLRAAGATRTRKQRHRVAQISVSESAW